MHHMITMHASSRQTDGQTERRMEELHDNSATNRSNECITQ